MCGIDEPVCDPYGLIGALSFDTCGSNERCVLFVLLLSACLSWTRLGGVTGPVICPLVLMEGGGDKIAGQSKNVGTLTVFLSCIVVHLQRCHRGVVL